MKPRSHRRPSPVLLLVAALLASCGKEFVDHPRLTADVVLQDVTFRSPSLGRRVTYRVIRPARLDRGQKLDAVYLLHGGGGEFRDWSNHSDVAQFAKSGLLLVMPDGASSYYANSVARSRDRYEDFIGGDLIADVEARFPVAAGRDHRAIAGVSMGGLGAIDLALRHPDVYAFAGALSPAIDVPRRSFTLRRLGQSIHYRWIFGATGSPSRREHDPFVRVRTASPETVPYLFFTCGEREGLLAPNREFAGRLEDRHIRHEFHTSDGGHDWTGWNAWLPALFESLAGHLGRGR